MLGYWEDQAATAQVTPPAARSPALNTCNSTNTPFDAWLLSLESASALLVSSVLSPLMSCWFSSADVATTCQ